MIHQMHCHLHLLPSAGDFKHARNASMRARLDHTNMHRNMHASCMHPFVCVIGTYKNLKTPISASWLMMPLHVHGVVKDG